MRRLVRQGFKLGDFELHWLEGGVFEVDGGAMFGVVPRVLWEKKCAATPDNYVRLADAAILVKTPAANILIDTGLGNKLTAKQQEIFRVRRQWDIPGGLAALGLNREDIRHVILTHCDFDHAGGIVMQNAQGSPELTFPKAVHYIQEKEWEDVLAPDRRTACTYWPVNFKGLRPGENLCLINGEHEVSPGVNLSLTGGHTRGHQIVRLSSAGEAAVHPGDLLPGPAHANPLWVTAYDNFPLDSVAAKEKIMAEALREKAWLILYHDPEVLALKFDDKGDLKEALRA